MIQPIVLETGENAPRMPCDPDYGASVQLVPFLPVQTNLEALHRRVAIHPIELESEQNSNQNLHSKKYLL